MTKPTIDESKIVKGQMKYVIKLIEQAQLQTKLECLNVEVDWHNCQVNMINADIELAKIKATNNGNQSIIIFNMILFQHRKRLSELKQEITKLEDKK